MDTAIVGIQLRKTVVTWESLKTRQANNIQRSKFLYPVDKYTNITRKGGSLGKKKQKQKQKQGPLTVKENDQKGESVMKDLIKKGGH